MFKKLLAGVSVALAFGVASAGTIQLGGDAGGINGKMSTKADVCTFTFNAVTVSNCGTSVTGNYADSNLVTGNISGVSAAPAGDTSQYLSIGPSRGASVTFTVSGTPLANYFGFFAGSLDSFNLVTFYLNGVKVDQFTGTQINAVAFPGQGTTGNQSQAQYIDYFASSAYNSVTITSTSNAFELDNLAIGRASVPEPSSVALLGLGALGLLVGRRRKA